MPRYADNGEVSLAYDVIGSGERDILVTLGWVVVIIAIFGPLGVRRYRNMSR